MRVFADLTGLEPAGTPQRPAFGMALFVSDWDSGRYLPGSPLFPEWAPPPRTLALNDGGLMMAERTGPASAFTFVLPDAWTRRTLNLTARAVAPAATAVPSPSTLCVQASCGAIPNRTITGVTFAKAPRAVELSALNELVVVHQDVSRPESPVTGIRVVRASADHVFAKLQALSPLPVHFYDAEGRPSDWPRFRAARFASDRGIWEPADAFDEEIGRPGDGTVGVFDFADDGGLASGHTAIVSGVVLADGAMSRPVTSVAHEVMHLLGFRHASTSCGAFDGESWPVPDGRMDSVGIDTTPGSGGGAGPYRIIADRTAVPSYDLMSYCEIASRDPRHWISARNWQRLLGETPPPATTLVWLRRALVVRASVGVAGRAAIASVASAQGPPPPRTEASAYALVARDAAGRVLTTVPVLALAGGAATGAEELTALQARVPREGVARVELVGPDGAVAHARSASAAAPRGRFVSPRRGQRVGDRAVVRVRWRASDADGDQLTASLDVATDGRAYRNVWAGPAAAGRADVPTELLPAARAARLRLRLSDGFRETTVRSARFAIASRRPAVQVLEPAPGQRVDAGATVRLRGAAVDDRGRMLDGRRLRWFAGRTPLGRGALVSAVLPAGTRRVRLEARDARGRRASATVPLRSRATTPLFLRLDAPARISRRAARVRLVVAATQPARLAVRGERHAVGAQPRTIHVPLRPGRAPVRLRLTLRAGGRTSVATVLVRRR